ncbi:YbgC/FadM family acyl-CoA thioesterase [Hydrogenophaga sp. 5NK40-0174]|uniref:YbgC/FadM family acyl-CoA thioesterase n=1 Tax=Hydrogenophaga sp. 5NK40-0174 TaxID=3127649 RepID=UPI00310BA7F0
MQRQDFRFTHRLRVRWAEVDMQKIVFNAHYLMYFDTAVADYWKALGLPYETGLKSLDGDLFVAKASLDFHGSARYEDELDVAMRCERVGHSSIAFKGAIFRGENHLISADIVYVFADPVSQKSRPVPDVFRSMLMGYEAGDDMLTVRVGNWAELGAEAQAIRSAVFVEEQGIPADLEADEQDTHAVHAVAYNRLGQAVGTGRMVQLNKGEVKVGRMAVDRAVRGAGIGQALLKALSAAARGQGARQVTLSAQRTAVGFYLRQGYQRRDAPYLVAGIEHQDMVTDL